MIIIYIIVDIFTEIFFKERSYKVLKRYQYKIKADVVSNQGNVRTNNEDNFFFKWAKKS